jgi:predicted glycosyltransferase
MQARPPRIAIFTHDAYGVGHVRRTTRIFRAIAEKEPRSALLLITGSPVTKLLRQLPQNADTIKIPTVVTSGADRTRPPSLNIGVAELASLRGGITRCALELFEPDVFLVDNFPLGTRLELLPALRELRHRPTRTVLGLRDVVDPPAKVKHDWGRDGIFDVIERYYDRVLVYGVREVFDAVQSYGLSPMIADRLRYCGYIAEAMPVDGRSEAIRRDLGFDAGFFLATVGGGGDGRPLIDAFLGALEHFPSRRALVVPGEFMSSDDRDAILGAAAAHPGVVVRDYVEDLPAAMAAADLVVAMGGYNTSAEILATRARSVLVPRTWRAGEHANRGTTGVDEEQQFRADGLARMGLTTVVGTDELSPKTLAAAMARALEQPRREDGASISLDGASCVADELLELAAKGS